MRVQFLNGKRVLLVALRESDLQTVHIIAGQALALGDQLHVQGSPRHPSVPVESLDVIENGFDPSVLPRLISPFAPKRFLELASSVDYCVPIVVSDVPPGMLSMPSPFYGSMIKDGRIVLLFGMPEQQAEPWEVDADETAKEGGPRSWDEEGGEASRGVSIAFVLEPGSDRELFWLELQSQRFPLYNGGLLDPQRDGTEGWITLHKSAGPDIAASAADWLRRHRDVVEVTAEDSQ